MTDADPAVPALPTIDPDRETQLTELEGKLGARLLQDAFDELELPSEDYKSTLQELLQERERRIPRYRISSQEGPDHARIFVATVEASGRILGEGRGSSKKQAEQAAAREALRHLARRGQKAPAGHSGR